jgi:peptidoglycan hydrolase-like protein with peptidoglycan-binding domain
LAASSARHSRASATLRSGDHGRAVERLQRLLAKAGFATPADGRYGHATVKVVRRFQRAANLRATGSADARTLAALRTATSGRIAINRAGGYDATQGAGSHRHLGDRIPLARGMSGHDVKILQDFLSRAGFRVAVDGDFGARTVRQVRAFEASRHVPVDGIVDAADIAVLRSPPAGAATRSDAHAPAIASGPSATVGDDGLAAAPAGAPEVIKRIIDAGNAIAKTRYIYGGGHGRWQDAGYDCSGSVSYALHGGGLLDTQLTSGDFEHWGSRGPGQWITIYANAGHVYMTVAGLRFDTSGRQEDGSRWHRSMRPGSGYVVVHPDGL